jgi:UDP-N-acetylmuramoylalanine--D-glutamate ligase
VNALNDIDVLVLGLGASGLAMARWCARQGARVRVWDSREVAPQDAALAADVPASVRLHGALEAAALEGVSRVFKSPGLAPADPKLAALTAEAGRRGLRIEGELDLFAQALASLKADRRYDPKVLAITGTNGKTTTTILTGRLVERAGRRVAVAGNVGPTMLDTLADALDAQAAHDLKTAAEVAAEEAAMREAERAQQAAEAAALAEAEAQVANETTVVDEAEAAAIAATDEARVEVDPAAPEDAVIADVVPEAADSAERALGHGATAEDAMSADESAPADDVEGPDEAAAAATPLPDDEEAPLVLVPPPEAAPVFACLPEVWVLELSSFQLDGVKGFSPTAATVLNVTQDHLDWHGDMAAYAAAKARIFGPDTVLVINRDDPQVEAMVPAPVVVKPTRRGERAKTVHRHVVRFGLDAPRGPGDFGVEVQNGMSWLVRAEDRDPTIKLRKGELEDLYVNRLMPSDALRIRGRHNASNALAALALAHAAGCGLAPLLHGLRDYRGEPHRVETIGLVGSTEFIDDSKGTNVGATVAALTGLGPERAPGKLVVILGGEGKGQDFAPLADGLRRYARAAATIGRDAAAIEAVLQQSGVPFARHDTLEAATRWCLDHCLVGDAVLLSPACASLDMFRDYAHRAQVFADTMHQLAEERGGGLQ